MWGRCTTGTLLDCQREQKDNDVVILATVLPPVHQMAGLPNGSQTPPKPEYCVVSTTEQNIKEMQFGNDIILMSVLTSNTDVGQK